MTLDGVGCNMLGEMLMERRSELVAALASAAAAAKASVAKQETKPATRKPIAAAEVVELLESDSEEPSPAAKPRAKRLKVAPEATSP